MGGWLCPTKVDLVPLVDMNPLVRRARLLAGLVCGLGVLALVPWIGWWPVAVFGLAPVPLLALDRVLQKASRPERLVAGSLSLNAVLILTGAAVSGGVQSPLLPWVGVPSSPPRPESVCRCSWSAPCWRRSGWSWPPPWAPRTRWRTIQRRFWASSFCWERWSSPSSRSSMPSCGGAATRCWIR